MMPKYLSKSNFMHWLIHPAYLWLEKHEKKRLPPITQADEFMFAKGHDFEALARKLFEEGKLVDGKPWEFEQLTRQTEKFMKDEVDTIFQATVLNERGLLAKSDVMKRRTDGSWDLYEIKSSTRVKDDHLLDLAFQVVAWEEAGISIGDIYISYVNRYYKRHGDIDPKKLVKTDYVSELVREQCSYVKDQIPRALAMMDQDERPSIDPIHANNLSVWMSIYFHLRDELPPDHPYRLAQIKPEDIRYMHERDIQSLRDIEEVERFNARQQSQIRAWQQAPETNRVEIGRFLSELEYPLWFLDYETISHALPLYEGSKPYQDVPFQYSLHKLESPDSEIEHFEYLATDETFPVPGLIEQLQHDLGEQGSILVWYENFEKTINTRMGEFMPEHQDWIEQVNNRIVDLMVPFAGGWYVDKHFAGSASLKNVLPVVAPKLSYKELKVQDGGSAQAVWYDAVFNKRLPATDKLFSDLLAYCALDTLAMVEIYWFLLDIMQQEDGEAFRHLEQQRLL